MVPRTRGTPRRRRSLPRTGQKPAPARPSGRRAERDGRPCCRPGRREWRRRPPWGWRLPPPARTRRPRVPWARHAVHRAALEVVDGLDRREDAVEDARLPVLAVDRERHVGADRGAHVERRIFDPEVDLDLVRRGDGLRPPEGKDARRGRQCARDHGEGVGHARGSPGAPPRLIEASASAFRRCCRRAGAPAASRRVAPAAPAAASRARRGSSRRATRASPRAPGGASCRPPGRPPPARGARGRRPRFQRRPAMVAEKLRLRGGKLPSGAVRPGAATIEGQFSSVRASASLSHFASVFMSIPRRSAVRVRWPPSCSRAQCA